VRTRFGSAPLLVDLVDGDENRDAGRPGVVDRLDRLRHHSVVGRDHDHGDVRDLRAAGAHRSERLVTRRIQEGEHPPVVADLVGADVLGDPAGLTGCHLGLANRVQQ